MKWNCCSVWMWAVLSACLPSVARAQITSYGVAKTGYYTQSSDAAPVLETGENHYFGAFVNSNGTTDIDSAILSAPGGAQVEMAPLLFYFEGFTSQAAIDNSFRNGAYSFQISTVDLDFFFGQLSLAGTYPSVPRVNNFAAAQSINAGGDFTLRWDGFVGGTAGDFILVTVDDDSGSTIFETPDQGIPGALTGQDTSVVIPAGTLPPGTNYLCYISFNKLVAVDTSSIPGALGVAAYVRETSLPLKTASSGNPLTVNLAGFERRPDGSILVQASGTAGATFTLEATSDFKVWTSVVTTNPPPGSFDLIDAGATALPNRFYRVKANF